MVGWGNGGMTKLDAWMKETNPKLAPLYRMFADMVRRHPKYSLVHGKDLGRADAKQLTHLSPEHILTMMNELDRDALKAAS